MVDNRLHPVEQRQLPDDILSLHWSAIHRHTLRAVYKDGSLDSGLGDWLMNILPKKSVFGTQTKWRWLCFLWVTWTDDPEIGAHIWRWVFSYAPHNGKDAYHWRVFWEGAMPHFTWLPRKTVWSTGMIERQWLIFDLFTWQYNWEFILYIGLLFISNTTDPRGKWSWRVDWNPD